MLKTFIRKSSSLPYEPVPINTYNQVRSAFNIKPKRTQGIVYNPPAAISKPSIKTANAFLPNNDPRKTSKVLFTKDELLKYPVINSYQAQQDRLYDVSSETVKEIAELRRSDPKEWTVGKLLKKFNIPANKVNVFSGKVVEEDIVGGKKLEDRRKRVGMWLRGEF